LIGVKDGQAAQAPHGAMRSALIAALVALALPAVAAAQPGAAAKGEALVRRNCAQCHAVGRDGDSPDRAAPPFRTLGARYPIDALAEGLAEGLLTGHPAMPEFRFTPDEVKSIVAYLKAIQVRQSAHYVRPAAE
jgi:mono/diheme cytochrome c family protein